MADSHAISKFKLNFKMNTFFYTFGTDFSILLFKIIVAQDRDRLIRRKIRKNGLMSNLTFD